MAPRAAITSLLLAALFWLVAGAASAQSAGEVWAERTRTGMAAAAAGKSSEALTLLRAALLAAEELGEDDPRLATAKSNLALQRLHGGDIEGARSLLEQALALRLRVLGPEHGRVAESFINLAALHQATGETGEAELALGKALAIYEKLLGPAHDQSLVVLDRIMALAVASGRYGEAIRVGRRALAAAASTSDDSAERRRRIGALLAQTGRWSEAEAMLREALAIDASPTIRSDLAMVLAAQDRHVQALELLGDTPDQALGRLRILLHTDQAAARSLYNRLMDDLAPDDPDRSRLKLIGAELAHQAGDRTAALAEVTELVDELGLRESADPRLLSDAFFLRSKLHREADALAQAITDLRTTLSLERQRSANTVPIIAPTLEALIETQEAAGLFAEARETQAELERLYR